MVIVILAVKQVLISSPYSAPVQWDALACTNVTELNIHAATQLFN